ncbi:MAG: transcription antitermination factor NusB [Chlorobi bacterium]|nr:transcription antitermination factor NusB [Chlorobiota bacterium]
MLYRRHLRIRALQALYAHYSSGQENLVIGEKQLMLSINKVYELFIYQLSFLNQIQLFAADLFEDRKKKYIPTEEDLNPNLKFINNKVLLYIGNNIDFRKKEELYKINWADEKDIIRRFYKKLVEFDFYKAYMKSGENTLEEDKKFMVKLIDLVLSKFDLLSSFYEEKSVYFTDTYDLVNILLIKFADTLNARANEDSLLPPLLKTENDPINTDLEFVKKLYRKVVLNNEEYDNIIKPKTKNWEYDRIPLMDLILIKMAITEFLYMSEVPVKVTLNEYIELSKYFSIEKSKIFINGVLDILIKDFKKEGKVKKVGQGMIDK